jgi:putative hemolysin
MRSYPALVFAAAGVLALAGCSSGSDDAVPTLSPQSGTSAPATSETRTAAPGAQEVTPGGVTTAVGAPAESTEEEYFQACNAARTWMTEKGGDLAAQIEPYLGELQRSDSAGPGTFDTPWSKLTPPRQAAVIVAVEAAAGELCG